MKYRHDFLLLYFVFKTYQVLETFYSRKYFKYGQNLTQEISVTGIYYMNFQLKIIKYLK